MATVTAQVTQPGSPAAKLLYQGASNQQVSLVITVVTSSATVYVGGPNVKSTNGAPVVQASGPLTLTGFIGALYFIGAAGSEVVSWAATPISGAAVVNVAGIGGAALNVANIFTQPQTLPVIDKGGQVFNVAGYGSIGNANDAATFNAAVNAAYAAGGGTVTWDYAATTTSPITVKSGVHVIGQGRGVSKITNTTSDIFNDSSGAWSNQTFAGFSATASGGHIFATAIAGGKNTWDLLTLVESVATKSAFHIAGQDGSQIWRSDISSTVARSVPLIALLNTTGDMNGIDIGWLWIQDLATATSYQIEVNNGSSQYAETVHIHDIVSENPMGGAIHVYQSIGAHVADVGVYDLTGQPSNNLIQIDTPGGNSATSVKNYSRGGGGSLTVYDIFLSAVTGAVVENPSGAGGAPIKIFADQYCSSVTAIGIGPNATLSSGGTVVWDQIGTPTGVITSALAVKEGSNRKQGIATLASGTVVVSNTSVTANSRILLTCQSLGTVTAPSALCVSARTAGTSFTILASQLTDTSVIAYEIFEPG